MKRNDSAQALKHLLDKLKKVLGILNLGTKEDKKKNYYLVYNATIQIMDICRILRSSVYSTLTIDYLAFAIISLEGNKTLSTIKYLEWRIKIYITLA